MKLRRTFFFLVGILLGITVILGIQTIQPGVALPVQGTILLYPQNGRGMVAGIADKHPSNEVCSAWLKAALAGASQDTLSSHYVIGECR